MTFEVNFDGLIGPTHNYSGLSLGNLASANNAGQISHPRAAALQGLDKMRCLVKLGYQQGILLPQLRPDLSVLRHLGFSGSDQQVINRVARQAPELLAMVYSASSMWAANAATVTSSSDSADGKVHLTVANLMTTAHRSIEARQTEKCLRQIFSASEFFTVHGALPATDTFSDEGAANHMRLCKEYGRAGLSIFVYGRNAASRQRLDIATNGAEASSSTVKGPAGNGSVGNGSAGIAVAAKFPVRQCLSASQTVARQHGIEDRVLFLQQNPAAIEAGVFHNDVVAVANGPLLFYHQQAFDTAVSEQLAVTKVLSDIKMYCVLNKQVSLEDAIASYLFNSQLLAAPNGAMANMTLIAPVECQQLPAVEKYLQALVLDAAQPIRQVIYVDLRQSMHNGGGPACLRLRVVLSREELAAVNPVFLVDEAKIELLEQWVKRYYRDELRPADLADGQLMRECNSALEALSNLLGLNNYYNF
ncbi:MAG: N-succinylarginine dihydrolase [Pseudomonadales bacterium]|nr:N-succinylarginine dihydrolase [Pseudomonadales bacterium]